MSIICGNQFYGDHYLAVYRFRSISCLNQVLFALNEEYCMNGEKAGRMIGGFRIKPREYKKRVDRIFTLLSSDKDSKREGVNMLKELICETKMFLENC